MIRLGIENINYLNEISNVLERLLEIERVDEEV